MASKAVHPTDRGIGRRAEDKKRRWEAGSKDQGQEHRGGEEAMGSWTGVLPCCGAGGYQERILNDRVNVRLIQQTHRFTHTFIHNTIILGTQNKNIVKGNIYINE